MSNGQASEIRQFAVGLHSKQNCNKIAEALLYLRTTQCRQTCARVDGHDRPHVELGTAYPFNKITKYMYWRCYTGWQEPACELGISCKCVCHVLFMSSLIRHHRLLVNWLNFLFIFESDYALAHAAITYLSTWKRFSRCDINYYSLVLIMNLSNVIIFIAILLVGLIILCRVRVQ